ncbi:SigE family RNA polymerase sigma factor [Angustibacter sp. Root456]|uniref:SigE family RNA polymerase sigma factor n=1 Tax=Angustibacter sp. Root456 TaxID=1736539 RepID=UPI000A721B9D|nr:SigE family RNA polymerase sigma factor [Angustibacter sp. Root456]
MGQTDVGTSFEAFVGERGPALLRLAWLLCADADAAEDLVQEALVKVLPRWRRIVAGGAPEPYVRSVIRTTFIDGWRRRRLREVLVDDDVHFGDERAAVDPAGDAAVRLTVQAALMRLTARQRAVLVLRFYEDLTEAAAARELGCSVSTVKSQTRHAIARLRVLAPELADLFDHPQPEEVR